MSEAADFEKSLKRLEEIVSKLEGGNLPLEESIALYNEGSELSEMCKKALSEAELSVKIVKDE